MSLADRLQKAQQKDRIAEVRTRVQERLVESLGPRLYDATLSDTELEGMVHQRLRELLDEEEGPLAAQEKLLIVRQIGDSVLGLGPLEPYIRDPEVTEVMVNNWDTIYVERSGKLYWTGHEVPRRRPAPSHDRQDRRQGRPPRGRGESDGGRASPRRIACERDHPAARDRRSRRSRSGSSPPIRTRRTTWWSSAR